MSAPRALTLLLLTLAGCPDTTKPPPDDTDETGDDTSPETLDLATVPLTGACSLADDYGGFVVSVGTDASNVDGRVADGVVPFTVLEELVREGDCAVLRRNNPYCDPGCDPGYTCDFDGTCVPYPVNQ